MLEIIAIHEDLIMVFRFVLGLSPQGGSVSPLLANVYIHYIFDLWIDHPYQPQQLRALALPNPNPYSTGAAFKCFDFLHP